MRKLFTVLLTSLLTILVSANLLAQCSPCTYSAPSGGTNFNFNGNETLCITADAGQINWNMNGSGNKICVATGVTWTQTFGGNFGGGAIVDVYGTLILDGGVNVNGTAIINIKPGGTFIRNDGGFGNGLTINNEGTVNFNSSSNIGFNGTFVLNNKVGATLNALNTTNFFLGNSTTLTNEGTAHIANLENEEGYLTVKSTGTLIVDRSFNNHGAFIIETNGQFDLPCNTLPGAAGATICSFRVGDKGAGKEFVNNSCIKINGNVTFDGVGTNNGKIEIVTGDLNLNKIVSGTNGSILVQNGVSTVALSGGYNGTNMKFKDVNTSGNDFDNKFNNNPSVTTVYSVDNTMTGCAASTTCTKPTVAAPTGTAGTCTGTNPNDDAKVDFTGVVNSDKADKSEGSSYTGVDYSSATGAVTLGNISFTSLKHNTQYTFRFWNGANDCYEDITFVTPNKTCAATCNLSASATGTNVSCNGGTNGSATVTASGNTGAVTYLWSNAATSASISGLAAGTYTVTVTETASCTATASYTVTEPTAMSLTCSKVDVTTNGGADGQASVAATGGTSPYTYAWSNGGASATITGLVVGTYMVTVTDANGCTSTCSSTLTQPSAGCSLTVSIASNTQPTCANNDGAITINVTGATGTPTYLWSNGATTQNLTGVSSGDYTVTVTDGTCTATATQSLAVVPMNIVYEICPGESLDLEITDLSLTNIQWQKNGVDIPSATGFIYTATSVGIYTYTSNTVGGCSVGQCCPIEVKLSANCCKPVICLPAKITRH